MCSGITFFSQYVRKIKTSRSSQSRFIFTFPRVCFLPLQKKKHASPCVNMCFIFPNKQTHLLKNFKEGKAIQHHHLPPTQRWNSTFSFKYKTASHQHDWTWHKRVGMTPRTPRASTCVSEHERRNRSWPLAPALPRQPSRTGQWRLQRERFIRRESADAR